MTVDLLDRTSSEPATSSPAPRASVDLPPVLDRDVRFGAAVYGSFLAASVIGIASSQGGRTNDDRIVARLDAGLYWAAHVWSDAVGGGCASAGRSGLDLFDRASGMAAHLRLPAVGGRRYRIVPPEMAAALLAAVEPRDTKPQ